MISKSNSNIQKYLSLREGLDSCHPSGHQLKAAWVKHYQVRVATNLKWDQSCSFNSSQKKPIVKMKIHTSRLPFCACNPSMVAGLSKNYLSNRALNSGWVFRRRRVLKKWIKSWEDLKEKCDVSQLKRLIISSSPQGGSFQGFGFAASRLVEKPGKWQVEILASAKWR